MIRATIEGTLSHTGTAISTATRSERSPSSKNYSIETLRTINGKGPVLGPFICLGQASGSVRGAPNGLRKGKVPKAAACDIEMIAITGVGPVHDLSLPQVLRRPCCRTRSRRLFDPQGRSCPGSCRCSGGEPGRHAGCDHAQSYRALRDVLRRPWIMPVLRQHHGFDPTGKRPQGRGGAVAEPRSRQSRNRFRDAQGRRHQPEAGDGLVQLGDGKADETLRSN